MQRSEDPRYPALLDEESAREGLQTYYRSIVASVVNAPKERWPRCCGRGCEPCNEVLCRVAGRIVERLERRHAVPRRQAGVDRAVSAATPNPAEARVSNETEDKQPPELMEQMDKAPQISAELRAKILADPNVAKIAEKLEMPLEEFVNQIGYYMNNPGAQPAYLMVSDENLKNKLGLEVPSQEELAANVRASMKAIRAGEAPSGFEGSEKKPMAMPSEGGQQLTGQSNPDLEDAVRKLRMPRKS